MIHNENFENVSKSRKLYVYVENFMSIRMTVCAHLTLIV
jgi:hypothetical protein